MNSKSQAFPTAFEYGEKWGGDAIQETGLTKREWFAGMALQGFLASYAGHQTIPKAEMAASEAVAMADALLAELAKPQP